MKISKLCTFLFCAAVVLSAPTVSSVDNINNDEHRLNALINAANSILGEDRDDDDDDEINQVGVDDNLPGDDAVSSRLSSSPPKFNEPPVLMRPSNAYDLLRDARKDFPLRNAVKINVVENEIKVSLRHNVNKLRYVLVNVLGRQFEQPAALDGYMASIVAFARKFEKYNLSFIFNQRLPAAARNLMTIALMTGVEPLPPNTLSHRIPLIVEFFLFNSLCALSYKHQHDWYLDLPDNYLTATVRNTDIFDSTLTMGDIRDYLEILLKLKLEDVKRVKIPQSAIFNGVPMFCTGQSEDVITRIVNSGLARDYYEAVSALLKAVRGFQRRLIPAYSYGST